MKREPEHTLKGFTIVEVLITLLLTSLAIMIAYTTLNYAQKLFVNYKKQNSFIAEFAGLKKRLDFEALHASYVIEDTENHFLFQSDSTSAILEINNQNLVFKKLQRCDTFHLDVKNVKKEYEIISNRSWSNKLINSLSFESEYEKLKYNISFSKDYEALVKLRFEQ